jgi:zinc protease
LEPRIPPSLRPLVFGLLLTVSPAAWPATTAPKVQVLENGLQVVLLEDHSSPLAAAAVWVHAGGKDESEQLAGFSHYLEHLIPRGTEKHAPLQQQLEIFRAGGLSAIQADYDRTFFFAEAGAIHLDPILEALFQQVSQATLSDTAVDRIRPTLTQEMKEAYAGSEEVLFLEQMRAAFPGQPYRFPYLGSFASLAALEHSSAAAFYTNLYVPNNMVLAIGGDINPGKTLARVKSLFGTLKPSKVLPAKPKFEPGFTGARHVVKRLPRMAATASVLFPVPGYRHPDRFALAVLARLLDDPASSSMKKEGTPSASDIVSTTSRFRLLEERGLLILTAQPSSSGVATKAARSVLAALKRVRREGFPEAEVNRMVRQMRLAATIQREPLGAMVQDLGEAALFGDVRYGWEFEHNLGKVTATDVKRVAATYLAGENVKTLLILPKEENAPPKEELDAIAREATELDDPAAPAPDFSILLYPEEKGALAPRPERRPASPTVRSVLPNGMVLLVKPDRSRGLVGVSLQVRAGSADDPPGREGLAQMVASALSLGTRTLPGADFRRRVAAIGSTFGVTTNRDSMEAGLTVFPEDLPEALTLLAKPVLEPAFPEDQVAAVRDRIRRFGELRSLVPLEAARDLVRERLYRGHPYANNGSGSEASLASISREEILAFHRRYYRPDRAVLTLVGDLSPEEGRKLVGSGFGAWSSPAGEKAPPEVAAGATNESMGGEFSRVVEAYPSAMILGFPGVPLADPQFPLVRALATLLAARGTLDLVLNQPMAYSINAVPEGLSRSGILSVEAAAPGSEASQIAYELQLRARAFGMKEVTPSAVRDLIAIERGRLLREKEGLYTVASNLGFYELLGAGFAAYDEGKTLPANLTPALLKEGAARYLDATRLVRVSAGPPPSR